jgi:hypothetical protein
MEASFQRESTIPEEHPEDCIVELYVTDKKNDDF